MINSLIGWNYLEWKKLYNMLKGISGTLFSCLLPRMLWSKFYPPLPHHFTDEKISVKRNFSCAELTHPVNKGLNMIYSCQIFYIFCCITASLVQKEHNSPEFPFQCRCWKNMFFCKNKKPTKHDSTPNKSSVQNPYY